MSDEVFQTIIDQVREWAKGNVKQVALMLNGEPLFDSKLEERLMTCKAAKLPNVGFTTNGQLMNEKRARAIIQADPDYVVFSFDSLDKEIFERGRLRLDHGRVLENILHFIDVRNKKKSNVRIVVRHIDSKSDGEAFKEYLKYFQKLLREDLDEVGYTKVHNASVLTSIDNKFHNNDNGTTPCGAVFNRLTIQHDGQVVLCPHDFNGEFNFGNVLKTAILDIYNSDKFNEIRNIHEQEKRNTMHKCDSCDGPELNVTGDMYAKYTPSGNRFYANVYTGFDYDEERNKLKD